MKDVLKQNNDRLKSWINMKRSMLGLLLITMMILTACSNEGGSTDVSAASKVTVTNEDVGFSLLKSVEADQEGNILISPTSVLIAMLMVYNGTDGETKAEIEEALQIDGLTEKEINEATKVLNEALQRNDDKIEVTLSNSLWLNDNFTFKDEFAKNMDDYFDAEIAEIDINDDASADRINGWVKKETNGLIEKLVDKPLSSDLIAYLINALYFNGTWTYEFDKNLTVDDTFFTDDGEIEMPFMSLNEELDYFETEDLQAVKLPYGEGEMSMQLFLPKENQSLDELVNDMTTKTWQNWQTEFTEEEGFVSLPKFKLEYETLLNEPLQQLGIEQAFIGSEANFSPMVETTMPLFISEVKQKTAIKVDESGTEAAAATSVGIEMTSAPLEDEPFHMIVNRPFMYAIYDENAEHILFIGVMKSPIANE